MVVVGDDDFRTREEYNISQNKRVWIKNDVCQIDIKESMCDSYDISHIEHLDYYVIINETKVYDMGTVYENNYLTRLFARGDMTEFFDWITMQKLYVQTVVVLIFLLMLNLFDKTIENKLLERKKERIIDDLIEFYLTLRDVYKITKFNLKEIKLETVRINNTIEVNVYRNRSCYDKKEKIVILRIREEEVNIIGLKILAWTLKDILVDLTGSDYEQEGKEVGYIVSNLLEPLRQEGIKL